MGFKRLSRRYRHLTPTGHRCRSPNRVELGFRRKLRQARQSPTNHCRRAPPKPVWISTLRRSSRDTTFSASNRSRKSRSIAGAMVVDSCKRRWKSRTGVRTCKACNRPSKFRPKAMIFETYHRRSKSLPRTRAIFSRRAIPSSKTPCPTT